MRKHRLKLFFIICVIISIFSIIVLNKEFASHEMKAASNYLTGNQVYIGNESYTVIDPNTMTLLADQATEDGEMTWNNAVSSLNNLPSNYGELGSKFVTGNLSLPKTSDLTSVTNNDQTALTTIPSISSDWWLGDASVDNRSRFVGANTNSLVTDVSLIENGTDLDNKVCLTDQEVIVKGLKPTKTEEDPVQTIKNGLITYNFSYEGFASTTSSNKPKITFYYNSGCTGSSSAVLGDYSEKKISTNANGEPIYTLNNGHFMIYLGMITNSGIKSYFEQNAKNSSLIGNKVINVTLPKANTCHIIKAGEELFTFKSYMITNMQTVKITFNSAVAKDITCAGHAQIAGKSTLRPLLTLNPNKIAYSKISKPTFNINPIINQPVPTINADDPYLTITDTDLGISLDSSNPNVTDNVLTVNRANSDSIVTIPVTLSGTTSGNRYVSAVAKTNNGDQYGVLGTINGTSGNIQLDLSNFPNWQSTKTISLTLYQEVDEGTKTTYRGNGTDISLDMSLPEVTPIFTPSSNTFIYNDSYTVVNGTVGVFSLQYSTGEPTSTIASIQLGTSGDESHFSIDTTGTLKVKGSDLDAGTYNITVSGKDANQMDFTKTIQIVVGKANQDNYQITNNANYNFQTNQEIAITTSGNESGENETYTITNGNSIAQISNTNKFQMLSAGTFTLEATVQGNQNYNPKTVTK
ncbi:MAG: hypothetical protein HFF02_09625, partial [Erysipelotrichaceae bacterium]|nr:hypothetical protein [Erysipelotrichaceae bacterium]